MPLRPALTLAAALAACGFAAPAADAITMTGYAVTIEGSATYALADAAPQPWGPWTHDYDAEFSWKSTVPNVTFIDKLATTGAGGTITSTVKSASMRTSIPTPEGPVTGGCTGKGWATPPTPPIISGSSIKPEEENAEGIYLRVFSGGSVGLPTCTGVLAPGPGGFGIGSTHEGRRNPFDMFFGMPHEAIGMGKIIQLLDRTVSGVNCPGQGEHTVTCTLTWKAKVTFVRTSHTDIGDPDPVIPLPPAPSPPAPGASPELVPMPPTPKPDVLDEDLIPLPKSGKLSASAGSATVPVLCPTGCTGTVVATPLATKRARASARKPLARVAFTAAPGKPTTVRLRFRGSARKAIRRAGGVRLAVAIHPRSGKVRTTAIALRLRR